MRGARFQMAPDDGWRAVVNGAPLMGDVRGLSVLKSGAHWRASRDEWKPDVYGTLQLTPPTDDGLCT